MRRFAFAVPGDLATPTGGYAYDRRMIAELERLGWQIDLVDLGDGFPWPSERAEQGRAGAAIGRAGRLHNRHRWTGARRSAGRGEPASQPQSADRAGAPSARLGDRPDFAAIGFHARERTRGPGRRQPCCRHQHGYRAAACRRLRRFRRPHRGGAAGQRSGSDGARRATTASCGCCRSARWCRAKASTC